MHHTRARADDRPDEDGALHCFALQCLKMHAGREDFLATKRQSAAEPQPKKNLNSDSRKKAQNAQKNTDRETESASLNVLVPFLRLLRFFAAEFGMEFLVAREDFAIQQCKEY